MERVRLIAGFGILCLAACSGQVDAAGPTASPTAVAPAAAQDDPAPAQASVPAAAAPQSPLERALAARAMPAQPPEGLFQHYFFRGKARFTQTGRTPLEQECVAGIGGPAQLRYELFTDKSSNVFLLESPAAAWVMSGDKREFVTYRADTLARETWIRWLLLRFPWGAEAELAAFEPGGDAAPAALEITGPAGTVTVELDAEWRPRRLVHPDVAVVLDGWEPIADGRQMPRRWTWTHEWGELAESFTSADGGVLFLDRSFTPQGAGPTIQNWGAFLVLEPGLAEQAERRIELVDRAAIAYLQADDPAAWAGLLPRVDPRLAPDWLRIPLEGAARYARPLDGDPPAALPPGVELHEEPAGLFLRWIEFGAQDPLKAVAELRSAAASNQLEVRGPAWARVVLADGQLHWQEFLLPVEQPKR
ncbi:MAG TPA: hypothetical protein VGC54_14640 [Planctomycetota bacterium]